MVTGPALPVSTGSSFLQALIERIATARIPKRNFFIITKNLRFVIQYLFAIKRNLFQFITRYHLNQADPEILENGYEHLQYNRIVQTLLLHDPDEPHPKNDVLP